MIKSQTKLDSTDFIPLCWFQTPQNVPFVINWWGLLHAFSVTKKLNDDFIYALFLLYKIIQNKLSESANFSRNTF